jgi:putative transposase
LWEIAKHFLWLANTQYEGIRLCGAVLPASVVMVRFALLFSSSYRRRKPGPKGPSAELIATIIELKRRNPRFGCVRIAQQISHAFGVDIDKNVVRRVLAKHYRPGDSGTNGPSWLTFISHMKDSLRSVYSAANPSFCIVTGCCWSWTCTRVAWSVSVSNAQMLTGSPSAGCSIAPSLASGYRNVSVPITIRCSAHRWLANLRVLAIEEVKSVPYAPVSHPFVERLIGTVRRECLDHIFFWNAIDLTRKLDTFADYYNAHRVHRSLDGTTPARRACASSSSPARAALGQYAWKQHCRGLFHTPTPA